MNLELICHLKLGIQFPWSRQYSSLFSFQQLYSLIYRVILPYDYAMILTLQRSNLWALFKETSSPEIQEGVESRNWLSGNNDGESVVYG